LRRLTHLLGPHAQVIVAILLVGLWASWYLELSPKDAIPSSGGLKTAKEFFSAAFSPAVDYEEAPPKGTEPLLTKVLKSMWQTVAIAATAVGLAFVGGLFLGFFASSAWWEDDPAGAANPFWRLIRNLVAPTVVWSTRLLCVLTRSIHELLWAILFLSVMRINATAAILAIAIPYTGVFAKVFSEIIDETPRDAAYAIRALGGSPAKVFLVGLLPRAMPDITAYACYRFECGLRSSAVMGFFGIPTIGAYLKDAFDELHYHVVWTYLWALILLIIVVDLWSGQMRRRLVH
jgi:phosphonate transport system permease protein